MTSTVCLANSGTDQTLNGTWAGVDEDGVPLIWKFNNGKLEVTAGGEKSIIYTYTTSGNTITTTATHMGPTFASNFKVIEVKWYTKDELIKALKTAGFYSTEVEKGINEAFAPRKHIYSISGNKLIIIITFEGLDSIKGLDPITMTFTKQP